MAPSTGYDAPLPAPEGHHADDIGLDAWWQTLGIDRAALSHGSPLTGGRSTFALSIPDDPSTAWRAETRTEPFALHVTEEAVTVLVVVDDGPLVQEFGDGPKRRFGKRQGSVTVGATVPTTALTEIAVQTSTAGWEVMFEFAVESQIGQISLAADRVDPAATDRLNRAVDRVVTTRHAGLGSRTLRSHRGRLVWVRSNPAPEWQSGTLASGDGIQRRITLPGAEPVRLAPVAVG